MSEKSFPWVQSDGDRLVTADSMAAFYAALFAHGTASGGVVVNGLEITKLGGSQVQVAAGVAVVQGRIYVNDDNLAVTPVAGLVKHRIVLRLDVTGRTCAVVAVAGDAGTYPALTQNDTTWEIGLGTVDNSAGSFTVADTRTDSSLSGIAATNTALGAHLVRTDNPHGATPAQIGAAPTVHNHSGQAIDATSVNIASGQVYKIGGANLIRISGGVPQIYVGGAWKTITHA